MSSKALVKSLVATVATAGVAVPLSGTDLYVRKAQLRAPASNSGAVFLGDSTVSAASGLKLAAGEYETLQVADPDAGDAGKDLLINLKDVYVDAATNGDKLGVLYYAYE